MSPPPSKWLFVGFDGSRCEEEAATQEVELGAAIHRTLQQLEAVDLPLVMSAAPRQAKACANSGSILSEADGEALVHPSTAGTGVGQPSVIGGGDAGLGRRGAATAANDSTEPATEPDDPGSLVILQHARDHCCGVGVEIIRRGQAGSQQ